MRYHPSDVYRKRTWFCFYFPFLFQGSLCTFCHYVFALLAIFAFWETLCSLNPRGIAIVWWPYSFGITARRCDSLLHMIRKWAWTNVSVSWMRSISAGRSKKDQICVIFKKLQNDIKDNKHYPWKVEFPEQYGIVPDFDQTKQDEI